MRKFFTITLTVLLMLWFLPAFEGPPPQAKQSGKFRQHSGKHSWKHPWKHPWKHSGKQSGKFRCLNPQSTMRSVEYQGLAPRLDTLDGKNILYYQSEANQVVMPVLLEKLQADYPTATFTVLETENFGEAIPTEEELSYDAMIRGVSW